MPLGTEVVLGPDDICVRWGLSSPRTIFWPKSVVPKRSLISATAELLLRPSHVDCLCCLPSTSGRLRIVTLKIDRPSCSCLIITYITITDSNGRNTDPRHRPTFSSTTLIFCNPNYCQWTHCHDCIHQLFVHICLPSSPSSHLSTYSF